MKTPHHTHVSAEVQRRRLIMLTLTDMLLDLETEALGRKLLLVANAIARLRTDLSMSVDTLSANEDGLAETICRESLRMRTALRKRFYGISSERELHELHSPVSN